MLDFKTQKAVFRVNVKSTKGIDRDLNFQETATEHDGIRSGKLNLRFNYTVNTVTVAYALLSGRCGMFVLFGH